MKKVHTSAVCVIPPKSLWRRIQSIRKEHDKGFARWMPHINVLYPFYADDNDGDALKRHADKAYEALADVFPGECRLESFKYFVHRRSCTLWLEPRPDRTLQEIHAALVKSFPECTDLSLDTSRDITSFVPHLSVGQWPNENTVNDALDDYQKDWETAAWTINEIAFISRSGKEDPFTVRWKIPLGGIGEPEEVNERYVCDP